MVKKQIFLKLKRGGGLSHLNEINTVLAGIDLSKNANRFTDILEELTDRTHNKHEYGMSEMSDTLYIMISQNRRKDLQKSFDMLTGNNRQCVWIAPYYGEPGERLEDTCASVIDWEVHYSDD